MRFLSAWALAIVAIAVCLVYGYCSVLEHVTDFAQMLD